MKREKKSDEEENWDAWLISLYRLLVREETEETNGKMRGED